MSRPIRAATTQEILTISHPSLGDTCRGRLLGKATPPHSYYIWMACITCGKERWVRLKKKEPENTRCLMCKDHLSAHFGPQSSHWKGGQRINCGYVEVWIPPDDPFRPMAKSKGYILEHRLIMAKSMNRCLKSWEVVHHINGIRNDNRIDNLQLVSISDHTQITILTREISRLNKEINSLKEKIASLEMENYA